jgi:hypothetical protein
MEQTLKYGVYFTAFHGGRLASQHHTLKGDAEDEARIWRVTLGGCEWIKGQ